MCFALWVTALHRLPSSPTFGPYTDRSTTWALFSSLAGGSSHHSSCHGLFRDRHAAKLPVNRSLMGLNTQKRNSSIMCSKFLRAPDSPLIRCFVFLYVV